MTAATSPVVPPEPPSLRRRALLAVALTVTFYALAIGLALALVVGPAAVWATAGVGNLWLTLALAAAGITILVAIVPGRAAFAPPGPELTREDHPRLHALLDDVAAQAGADPADAVFLDLPVNAAVLEHRGRRIMLLGLPLLATLSRDELRAVVAHEYGHYVGGDTQFGTWIWRTRASCLKAVEALATSDSWFQRHVLRRPFEWYALLFLRITNAISRRAEFAADALAARVASPQAAGSALRRLEAVAPAFDGFWTADVAPMLEERRRPAIASGFAAMTAHTELSGALDEVVRTDLEGREPDPYASHPTLRQRLEALGVPAEASAPAPADEPAVGLLDDVPLMERRLLVQQFGDEVGAFPVADWSEASEVHLARLRDLVARFGPALPEGLTIGTAGAAAAGLAERRPHLRERLEGEDRDAPPEALDGLLFETLASAVVLGAERAGATVTAAPGEPIRVHAGEGGAPLDPWLLLGPIAAGEADAGTWTGHPVVRALAAAPLEREPVAA